MFSAASADCGEKFATLVVQCVTPVFAANEVGEQLLETVTAPCCFTNATGIVTLFAPFRGRRVIRPWYWPVATSGAEIVTGKVTLPPFGTWIAWPLLTVIVTPAGAVICASRFWFFPETLIAVRRVDRRDVQVDPVQRVAARGDHLRVGRVEDQRRVHRAVDLDAPGAHVEHA